MQSAESKHNHVQQQVSMLLFVKSSNCYYMGQFPRKLPHGYIFLETVLYTINHELIAISMIIIHTVIKVVDQNFM